MTTDLPLDLLVVGAGLHGLTTALAARRAGARVLVLEREPAPGGSARTQRTEGFACELGPFALADDELAPVLAVLPSPPPQIGVLTQTGWVWDGQQLHEVAVDGAPKSGRSGVEDFVHALRRELGADLRLGRTADALELGPQGWTCRLAGEVPTTVAARDLHLCLPVAEQARLLQPFDPALPQLVERLATEPRAFVHLGAWQDAAFAQSCRGYGIAVHDPQSPIAEILFCSNAFPGRAVAGKALVRIEVGGAAAADPEQAASVAEAELRRITGWTGRVLFRRSHPFAVPVPNAAHTECRVRISELSRRAAGLRGD